MENQHRKISGYRELTQAEIDLMNEIKAFGPQLEALCSKIDAHIGTQYLDARMAGDDSIVELARLDSADPSHWAQYGRATLQTSLMYLTRAVAQPTFF